MNSGQNVSNLRNTTSSFEFLVSFLSTRTRRYASSCY